MRIALLSMLVCAATAQKVLEWCAYPYGVYDPKISNKGFVLVEVNNMNKGVNWWSPIAHFDYKSGTYQGLKALLYFDDHWQVEKIQLKGFLKSDNLLDLGLVEVDLALSAPEFGSNNCFCTSPGNRAGISRLEQRGDCDPNTWDSRNPWSPNPNLQRSPFNPPNAIYNCPKCERGLCAKGDNPYERWVYFKSTKGVLKNLKGKDCQVYTGALPLPQFGVEGANGKNDWLGLSFWFTCDEQIVHQYDINLDIGPCCDSCDPYANIPKSDYELYVTYGLHGEPGILLDKIATMIIGNQKK